MRAWQVERRKRTRHLIELGGLVVKARVVDLTGDDRAISSARCSGWQTSSKAIKANRHERSGPQWERGHSLWNGRKMRPPSRRKRHGIGHDRWRAARRLQSIAALPRHRAAWHL
jgi:Conjugal transfer protein TraD